MRVGIGAVAVVVGCLGAMLIRYGVRDWRAAGGGTLSQRLATGLMDAESRAGYERGSLILGLAFAFMAAMLAVAAVAGPRLGKGTSLGVVWVSVGAASGAAMLVCILLFGLIKNFNHPKFLVPPRHRGELGAYAGRRRRRLGQLPML